MNGLVERNFKCLSCCHPKSSCVEIAQVFGPNASQRTSREIPSRCKNRLSMRPTEDGDCEARSWTVESFILTVILTGNNQREYSKGSSSRKAQAASRDRKRAAGNGDDLRLQYVRSGLSADCELVCIARRQTKVRNLACSPSSKIREN